MRHRYGLILVALAVALAGPASAGTLTFYESGESPGVILLLPSGGPGLFADIVYDASTGEGGGLKGRISELEILAVGGVSFTGFNCTSTSTTAPEDCLVAEASASRIFLTAGDSSGQGPNGGNPNELPFPPSVYDLGEISFGSTGPGSILLSACNYTSAEGATGQLRTCDPHTLVQVVPEPGTAALLVLGLGALALRRRARAGAAAGLAALCLAAVAGPADAAVPNPAVTGPIPDSQGTQGHPLWDSWYDLGPFGYVEAEYFLSGTARQVGSAATAAYTTRILVFRPADAADFNGTVVMEWVNVTAQFENAVDLISAHDYLIRDGYAFVHVSAQAAGVGDPFAHPLTLKGWDPVRYADLDHPGDNYSFDMFAQAAQGLRSPQGIDMMGGLAVERIIAAGQSQSADRLQSYLTNVQGDFGEDVVDGFLIHGRVGGNHVAISTAATARATPVLQLSSDFEAHAPDPVASAFYALWEVAGAAHADFWIGIHQEEGQGPRTSPAGLKMPSTADEDLHQGNLPFPSAAENYGEQVDPGQPVCIAQGNQYPMHYAVNGAIEALDLWLRTGEQAASGPRFAFSGNSLARDSFGNASGGIRLAPIEHPVAEYRSVDCQLGGTTVPFTELEIAALYPTHAEYACLMKDTTYQNVRERWMLREDAVDLLARVDAASNRWTLGQLGIQDCDADGVADAIDNCPHVANPGQEDTGGVGTPLGDGTGNACQCGDVTGDGIVDGVDRSAIERHGLGIEPNLAFIVPGNCDVDGNGVCNGQDASATQRVLNGLPALFGQKCQNADPFAPDCVNCF